MAHILVYIQRSPRGIHPASAVALCVARDLGSQRGASIFGLCLGDGGPFDEHVVAAAGKAGADQIMFVGPHGLRTMVDRLRPKHLLTPWTVEADQAVQAAGLDRATPAWIGGPVPDVSMFTRVVGIVAGTLPWHQMQIAIEAEFEGQVDQAPVPPWLAQTNGQLYHDPALYFVAPADLDPNVRAQFEALGAQAVGPDYAAQHQSGTLLWLDAGAGGLPEALAHRPRTANVIAMPGPLQEIHASWSVADWVIPGPWDQAAQTLAADHWRAALM